MTAKKQQNPNIDFGFYATVPRLVRTDYREITPIQKWLYTCLKDLCGDTGTCYRALRSLSEETGISIGLLSESIPVLHKAGLIHAEKKKRATGGKEVWHITIIDIWLANGKTHPSKRSHDEQTIPENVHFTNVQDVNIHNVNKPSQECSPDEQECSQILHRSNNTRSKNITEERTNNDMSNDISVTHADELSDESKNTVSDGGNDTSDFQEAPSDQTPNSQALSEQIEVLIQEVDKPLPAQNEAPKNESEPQIGALPPNKEKIQPASCSQGTTPKRTRKARSSKGNVSLTDTTPIPPPVKPSEDQLWTPLTCMQLADYYRGSVLEESTRKGSKYDKAVTAAIKLVNQQRKTYQEVDRVFRFMKCLDKYVPDGLWDEWWDGKDVDLWNVGDHCNAKLAEIERKKKALTMLSKPGQSNQSQQQPVPSMTSEEAKQLAQDVITQAKAYGYIVQAQAVTSKKVEGAWIVKVKWDNEDGFVVPPIRTREQWQKEFKSIHENLSMQTLALAKREAK